MTAEEMNPSDTFSAAIEALVAVGVAVASNDETLVKQYIREVVAQGVSRGDVALAIATVRKVKGHVDEQVLKAAGEQLAAARDVGPLPGSCCCVKLPVSPRE